MFIKRFENFIHNDISDLIYLLLEEYKLIEVPLTHSTESLSLDIFLSNLGNDPSANKNGYFCISNPYNEATKVSIIANNEISDDLTKSLKSLSKRLQSMGYKYKNFEHGAAMDGYYRYYISIL